MAEELFRPDCVRTVGGRYVNVIDPDPDTLHIEDIAHALSNTPRFGGHLPVFYSVAHHSLQVCARLNRLSREEQFQGLMHDASEAFLCDIPAPLKAHLPEYKVIEARMMKRMAAHFGFRWPMLSTVHLADRAALREEWDEIMLNKNGREWIMTEANIKDRFLERFHQLKP